MVLVGQVGGKKKQRKERTFRQWKAIDVGTLFVWSTEFAWSCSHPNFMTKETFVTLFQPSRTKKGYEASGQFERFGPVFLGPEKICPFTYNRFPLAVK